ncbi:MAG: retroviral-like aspartic protease family protein [Candidatus Wallbacteria bacterium]|nr:retroviral-like aspartic protease family protein [Candidatus Wallbacteria bacterium]
MAREVRGSPLRWGTVFQPGLEHIRVWSRVFGPKDRGRQLDAIFDTGTSTTIIQMEVAAAIGLGPERSLGPCEFRGVHGVECGYWVRTSRLQTLGRTWHDFKLACLPIQADLEVDCLLGLDLLKGLVLTVDFKRGAIELEE